jgi:hypothetical protein
VGAWLQAGVGDHLIDPAEAGDVAELRADGSGPGRAQARQGLFIMLRVR